MSKCGRNSIPGLKEADAFTRGSAPLAMKMDKLIEDTPLKNKMLKDLPFNLREQLKEIASDDGINYTDYSTKEIIDEAKEFKLRYDGNIGFMEQDMLNGDFGASDKKEAQKGYRDIKRFLSKYQ